MLTNDLKFGIIFDERGIPQFYITEDEFESEPMLVLSYPQVQQLLGCVTDFLIVAEDYFEDES